MRLDQNNCCALVIDYQQRLVPAMFKKEELIQNSIKLIKGLSLLGIPMVVSEQYPKGLGTTVDEIKEVLGDSNIYEKTTFSALGCAELLAELKEYAKQGRKYVLICGAETHICVLQSAIDLLDEGFKPVFITDCISSRKPEDLAAAFIRAEKEGIELASTEMVLFEIIKGKAHPHFKEISAIIK